jgi:hypothetical protein
VPIPPVLPALPAPATYDTQIATRGNPQKRKVTMYAMPAAEDTDVANVITGI